MAKTVYVLGAGFSAGVISNVTKKRIPSQEYLVEEIFKQRSHFPDELKEFEDFLTNVLEIPSALHNSIPLEDIFTPLDKCVADGLSFRALNNEQVRQRRELVYYLIGKTLEIILDNVSKNYIADFAKYLVEKSSARAKWNYGNVDPVSVLTTNWDILLDNSIKQYISMHYDPTGVDGPEYNAVVDYGCQISSYMAKDVKVKPGLEMLGKGGFNVKLYKLHGSLNWLQCPRCNRVYVDFGRKIAIQQYKIQERCRHCNKNFGDVKSHIMISNLIMPTFLKNLLNPQLKMIWYNAAIELSEATKIVFIGYSLPPADFEMKQLLSRMVKPNIDIDVVDFADKTKPKDIEKIEALEKRYKLFFGNRNIKLFDDGVIDYVENHLA